MRRLLLLVTLVGLLLPAVAVAAPSSTSPGDVVGTVPPASSTQPAVQRRFDPSELERELMCPTCKSPLYLSHSPAADRIRAYVAERADEGWTKQQVLDALEADFGAAILASPKAEGLGLAAWLVPLAGVAGGLVLAIGLAVAWRRRSRPAGPAGPGGAAMSPDLEARVDDALEGFDP